MNITLLDFQKDPGLRVALEAAARRDRARHIVRLVGHAFTYLFASKGRHAPRAHFARQG